MRARDRLRFRPAVTMLNVKQGRRRSPNPLTAPASRFLPEVGNRYGHRDASMILLAYRHGLRVSELVDLRWDQIDFDRANLAVRRVKQGSPGTHPIQGDELRALRRLQREQEHKSPFVFTSERGPPFTTAGFARLIERAGAVGGLGFKAHPHMLRHACGFALANKGARYPGPAGLPGTQEHSAYGSLHRAATRLLQRLLE
jgi:integrase